MTGNLSKKPNNDAEAGRDGVGVKRMYVQDNKAYVVLTDNRTLEVGWIRGDKGDKGDKGDTGDSGVYIGTEEPQDPEVRVWIDPTGHDGMREIQNILSRLKYTDGGVQVDLGDKADSLHEHHASDISDGVLSVERGGTGTSRFVTSGFVNYNKDSNAYYTISPANAASAMRLKHSQYTELSLDRNGDYYAEPAFEWSNYYEGGKIFAAVCGDQGKSPVMLYEAYGSSEGYPIKVWSVFDNKYIDVPLYFLSQNDGSLNYIELMFQNEGFWAITNAVYAEEPRYINYVLRAENWVGDTAPYTYAIEGYEGKEVMVYEDGKLATVEQVAVFTSANIKGSPTTRRGHKLYAFGTKPTINLPVALVVKPAERQVEVNLDV